MTSTALRYPQTDKTQPGDSAVHDRLPTLDELHHADADSDPEVNLATFLFVLLIMGLVVCGFMVGHRDGVTAGKEAVCTETGWQSPTCKTELHRRLYAKDVQ